MKEIVDRIQELKKKHNAVILAHYYQIPEIQAVADMVGDSYGLSKKSADTDADVIVFCGVKFMAESAKILSPEKTVILPNMDAGCPMADMITAEDVKKLKKQYPDAAFVCYVNTSAEVKAECDVCCTSSNSVKIVNSLEQKRIVFLPDKNLGRYVAENAENKEVITVDGYCPVHDIIVAGQVLEAKEKYPGAPFLVHPECPDDVIELADFVGSTTQILNQAGEVEAKTIIVGTEDGILYKLKEQNPDKEFVMVSSNFVCDDMKKTTLNDLLMAFESLEASKPINVIELDEEIRSKAQASLDRMLELS
ncbi:MAG: quinolinate synthase NadA [Clostridia bacterium]|nr:quinolinate synthase NadA [Clostridia bacterium]